MKIILGALITLIVFVIIIIWLDSKDKSKT